MPKRNSLFWGEEARIQTAHDYKITALNHYRLLPNQQIEGECGNLTDRCYVLELQNKETKRKYVYNVGYVVAEHLLELTNQPKLPIFNLLVEVAGIVNLGLGGQGGVGGQGNGNFHQKLSPLNREFFNAINIVMIAWRVSKPSGLFKSCLTYLRFNPGRDTQSDYIQKLNTCLSGDKQGRTLQGMIKDIRNDFNNVREFKFPRMIEVLGEGNNIE